MEGEIKAQIPGIDPIISEYASVSPWIMLGCPTTPQIDCVLLGVLESYFNALLPRFRPNRAFAT